MIRSTHNGAGNSHRARRSAPRTPVVSLAIFAAGSGFMFGPYVVALVTR